MVHISQVKEDFVQIQ